jgi:hypothetical protein
MATRSGDYDVENSNCRSDCTLCRHSGCSSVLASHLARWKRVIIFGQRRRSDWTSSDATGRLGLSHVLWRVPALRVWVDLPALRVRDLPDRQWIRLWDVSAVSLLWAQCVPPLSPLRVLPALSLRLSLLIGARRAVRPTLTTGALFSSLDENHRKPNRLITIRSLNLPKCLHGFHVN